MEQATNLADAIKLRTSALVAQRGAVVVFVVLTLLLIVICVAYIVWCLYRAKTNTVDLVKDPMRINGRSALRVASSKLPVMPVGQDYSISFWLYLTDVQMTALPQLVMLRRASSASTPSSADLLRSAGPVVFMDGGANRMNICVRTNRARGNAASSLHDLLSREGTNWSHLCARIDYVPLQRWVNVAFSVQDNLLNVYLDGSLYTVESLDAMPSGPQKARPMFAASSGDIVIGNSNKTLSADVKGYVARAQLFNYALSSRQALGLYEAGPSSSAILGRLGLPDYGVRSPFYRLDDSSSDANNADGQIDSAP
jgi:hypothetical protein